MLKKHDSSGLVLALFFCSGATALVYEVVWSKFLSQMFGSTVQAQTVVLAVFMGGLALGNRLLGRKSDTLREPLRAYGFLEVAIGLYAFGFVALYGAADQVFVSVGSNILERRALLLALKGALSVALLIVPTVLMGGTLPLLAAWLQKQAVDAGRCSARFYSVNSLGAVCGAGVAGFYLVQTVGMVPTLQITALANVVIGGVAILLSRRPATEAEPQASVAAPGDPGHPGLLRWAGALAALTGGVSMGLEVLASRSLALIFGSSLQAFAVVLMAFILGIGLGSAAVASTRLRRWNSERLVVLLLLAAAAWIGLLVFQIESWVEIYRVARAGLARSTVGYVYHQVLTGVLSMIVLGVPAAVIGSVLPLLIRTLSPQVATLGAEVGRLLTWNTCGAVGGVLLTGFVLMPHAGLRNSFGVLAVLLCAVALITAWHRRLRSGLAFSGGTMALLAALFVFGDDGWRHVMSSGVFRAREIEVDAQAMAQRKKHIRIVFYEDAPDATVSVEHGDGIGAPADIGLRINGKADASTRSDLCTQLLVGHLPLLARPESKDVFILGLGSGITGGAVLGHPVEHLTIAENCEPVLRAAQFFNGLNRGVLTNARARIWVEDARTILKLSPQRYDVIITQPSNPWMVGVGSVFSREYYELGASRLKAGGILAQWFQIYDMHDGIVELVLRTFGTVFPCVEVWDCGGGDIILLGSKSPWRATPEIYQKCFNRERPRQDLARIGIHSPAELLTRQLASQRTGFAIPDDGPIQMDGFPVLEYAAPRAFYIGTKSTLLARFDERTWQARLAPADKARTLESLSTDSLRSVFGHYTTINEELLRQLQARLNGGWVSGVAGSPWGPMAPGFFAPTNRPPPGSNLPADAGEELRQLTRAAWLMESHAPQARDGVDLVAGLLKAYRADSKWPPAPYAVLAARTSLGHGDAQKAQEILQLALPLAPQDLQLRYLARIAARDAANAIPHVSLAQ